MKKYSIGCAVGVANNRDSITVDLISKLRLHGVEINEAYAQEDHVLCLVGGEWHYLSDVVPVEDGFMLNEDW